MHLNESVKRLIHVAGMVVCFIALIVTSNELTIKVIVAKVFFVFGFLGNVYGIYRPSTWFR